MHVALVKVYAAAVGDQLMFFARVRVQELAVGLTAVVGVENRTAAARIMEIGRAHV